MPVSTISAAQVGQIVKFSGTLTSESSYPYPVALSGQELRGKGCTWNWDERARFTLSDGSGVIPVTVSRYWEIADGPHPNPNRQCDIAESEYYVGDSAIIMGSVLVDGSGVKYLQAFIVSPDASHPIPNVLGWFVVGPFLILAIGLWLRIGIVERRRLALHRAALRGKSPMPLSTFDETKDPSLPWQRNSIPSTLLERARFVVLFTAVPWSFPAIGWYLSNPHTQNMYLIFGLVATFSAFLSVTVLTMSILGRIRPSAMAVTKEGIHFWYSRPADRYEMEPLIPWSEVTEVKQVVLNRSRQLVLVKSSGGTTSLGWPSAGIRDAIQKAWSDRASNSLHRD